MEALDEQAGYIHDVMRQESTSNVAIWRLFIINESKKKLNSK